MVPEGKKVRVRYVYGGWGLIRRLYALGFIPGEIVQVIKSSFGPIVVYVRGTRIALGRGVARKIIVEEVE